MFAFEGLSMTPNLLLSFFMICVEPLKVDVRADLLAVKLLYDATRWWCFSESLFGLYILSRLEFADNFPLSWAVFAEHY